MATSFVCSNVCAGTVSLSYILAQNDVYPFNIITATLYFILEYSKDLLAFSE